MIHKEFMIVFLIVVGLMATLLTLGHKNLSGKEAKMSASIVATGFIMAIIGVLVA